MPLTAKGRQGSGPSGLSGCGGGVDEDPYGLGRVSREGFSHSHNHSHSHIQFSQGMGAGLGLGLDVLEDTNEAARTMLYLQSDRPVDAQRLGSSSYVASSSSYPSATSSSSSSSSSSMAVYDRDNVTLLEHCYDDPANAWTKKGLGPTPSIAQGQGLGPGQGYDMGEGMLAEDDTMVVLDRLRDLTTRTLHLQVGLKYGYIFL